MASRRHYLLIACALTGVSASAADASAGPDGRSGAYPSAPGAMSSNKEPEYAIAAINRGIGPGETLWHMRAALNVASLSCWGDLQRAIASNYNQMLKRHREALARAYAAEQAAYRVRYGSDWQRQNDTHQTRLYDFFTKPMAQVAFCTVALEVSDTIRAMPPGKLESYAPGALARLERPFVRAESASR